MNAMENWKSPCVVDIPCPIVVWLRDTFLCDPDARVTKDEVYAMYEKYCRSKGLPVKRNSDFGKIMKKAFPEVVSRRLGSAGQQKSHYSGICFRRGSPSSSSSFSVPCSPPCSPKSSSSSAARTSNSPKLRRKTPGSSARRQQSPPPTSPSASDSLYEAYHSPPRPTSSRKRKGREVSEEKRDKEESSKAARALDFKRMKSSPPAVPEEHKAWNLPPNLLAPPNIVIHNTVTLGLNPHSSTDAFFSASSASLPSGPTPITNLDIRVSSSQQEQHQQQQRRSPMEQSEEHSLGNDQTPPVKTKPIKRMRELVPLPDYISSPLEISNFSNKDISEKRFRNDGSFSLPSAGLEEEETEFTELQHFPAVVDHDFVPSTFSPDQILYLPSEATLTAEEGLNFENFVVIFQNKMWPLVPLPAAVLNPVSVEWYLHEGRSRSTKLTLFINLALYYAAVSSDNLIQARQLFDVLLDLIPNFYNEQDLTVALVLAMLSSSTFSWLDADQALLLSRDFLATALRMCEGMDQVNSEVYHMCLDMRSWIEAGRLAPSLHARFPLHNNDYPPFLLPCRVAIKQCFHLVAMVRHIVFILENAPRGTVLPPSAHVDVNEKLSLLKACYTNMSSTAMAGHPFLANYIKLLLVGSLAELRAVLGHTEKAKMKAMLFTDLCGATFPFVDVVFYARRVFDILMANGIVEHAKKMVNNFSNKYLGLKDVQNFVHYCNIKLDNIHKPTHSPMITGSPDVHHFPLQL